MGLAAGRVEVSGLSEFRPALLVVEDDEPAARTLVRALNRESIATEFVLSGADALTRAVNKRFDVILVDLHLPDMSGFLVVTALRARYPHTPIVTMTGWFLDSAHEIEARALGVFDYLYKPLDASMVAARVRAAISAQAASAAARPATSADGGIDLEEGSRDALSSTAADADEIPSEATAAEDAFVRERLPGLQRAVGSAFPTTARDVIADSVEDALLGFLDKLKRGVWPAGGFIERHLYQASWRNVRDRLQSEARRREREARYANEWPRVTWPEGPPPETPGHLEARLEALAWTNAERAALRAWRQGAGPLVIAAALGLSDLQLSDQLREVKRFRDRIKRRAKS